MTEERRIAITCDYLRQATAMLGKSKESQLRHLLSAHLPQIFPDLKDRWWVDLHAKAAEQLSITQEAAERKTGFIDTLVGATPIEYEKDLSRSDLAIHGEDQVREYCAGLINAGFSPDNIVGILSDTARWRAYKVTGAMAPGRLTGRIGKHDIELVQIEAIDCTRARREDALAFIAFLERHLGRVGGRLIDAESLVHDLGLDSPFCERHMLALQEAVDEAFLSQPSYAALIQKVWVDFVSYLGDAKTSQLGFDRNVYTQEFYILTLAKLFCANVLESKAILSDDQEVRKILDGSYFKARGFSNLVEYDYFGWLSEGQWAEKIIPIAKGIQEDLRAYDFKLVPKEDVFGGLMVQLARKSQRLLLGQEWTPAWLARAIVEDVIRRVPDSEDLRLVDMCCGSGTMIVEAVKLSGERLRARGVAPSRDSLQRLAHSITGFDVDPLAVLLAKVAWISAAKEWIDDCSGFDVSIPVYHADSLFTATPISKALDGNGSTHSLDLDGMKVNLPASIINSSKVTFFDELIAFSYRTAMSLATSNDNVNVDIVAGKIVGAAISKVDASLEPSQIKEADVFVQELLTALISLQRAGRNGIWAFILGNTYRPGLVSGVFNGLVSNPPWLAMSKIADNPYRDSLLRFSRHYGIKPRGASHLHSELATIFLLNAVGRYLAPGAAVGCILPESVTSADHHQLFRSAAYLTSEKPVDFSIDQVWWVDEGTFKNNAVVVFGSKAQPGSSVPKVTGSLISSSTKKECLFSVVSQGARTAWVNQAEPAQTVAEHEPPPFLQGADIFPRTAIFHDFNANGERYDISPIDKAVSPLAYLVKEAKNFKEFKIAARGISRDFVFDVLTSNHLAAYKLAAGAMGLMPITKTAGKWRACDRTDLATSGSSTEVAIGAFLTAIKGGSPEAFFANTDTVRRKLSSQIMTPGKWLVVMGAGGERVCAAMRRIDDRDAAKLVIDQTLYWCTFATEEEAIYYVGMLNSYAISEAISAFQARGAFGGRHVHTLPLKLIPKFNPFVSSHSSVVRLTSAVVSELESSISTDPSVFESMLSPNTRLSARRSALRKAIGKLTSSEELEVACRSVIAGA